MLLRCRHREPSLDLELSELESLRRLGLDASHQIGVPAPDPSRLHRLTGTAMRRSSDGHVRLGADHLDHDEHDVDGHGDEQHEHHDDGADDQQ